MDQAVADKPTDDPALERRVDSLLKGAIDMHCHSGPSVMPRCLDHIEALEEAGAAGLRGLLFKDHYYSATPITELLKGRYARLGVQMFSGVPLNDTTGGLNPWAVDHGLKLGARLVWMPTFSAANHIRHKKQRGVKRRLVQHPTYTIDATLTDIRELAEGGAYLEHSLCMFIDESRFKHWTGDELNEMIVAGTFEHTILGSDLGQIKNPTPVTGFRAVIRLCISMGYSDAQIRALVGGNAARLMGIDDN